MPGAAAAQRTKRSCYLGGTLRLWMIAIQRLRVSGTIIDISRIQHARRCACWGVVNPRIRSSLVAISDREPEEGERMKETWRGVEPSGLGVSATQEDGRWYSQDTTAL